MKQALLLFQLEMWKNELTLYDGFEEFVRKNDIEVPPVLGSAMIIFKTCKIVDPELYEKIKGMEVKLGLMEVIKIWGVPDTPEDQEDMLVQKGTVPNIQIPINVEEIAKKLEGNEPITIDDVKDGTMERPDKALKKDADFKVERDGLFGDKEIKKVDKGDS